MSNNEKLDICNKALLRMAGVENPEPQYAEPECEFDENQKSIYDAIFPINESEVYTENGITCISHVPDAAIGKLSTPRDIKITNSGNKKEFKVITGITISKTE